MKCQACGHENPRQTSTCTECGTGLGRRAARRDQNRFRQQLETSREDTDVRRRRRDSSRRGGSD